MGPLGRELTDEEFNAIDAYRRESNSLGRPVYRYRCASCGNFRHADYYEHEELSWSRRDKWECELCLKARVCASDGEQDHFIAQADRLAYQWQGASVYAIGWQDGLPVKIGLADSVAERLRGLQTGNPYRLRCVAISTFKTRKQARQAEGLLHCWYRSRCVHVSKEWFNISFAEAREGLRRLDSEKSAHLTTRSAAFPHQLRTLRV